MIESNSSPVRPRRFPLRFGLRTLLAAITAIAIGLGVWFLPYREEQIACYEGPDGNPDDTRPHSRHVQTWQRRWDGSRVLHGTWESYHINSDSPWSRTPWLTRTYRHGRRHGPDIFRDDDLTYSLHYENDELQGVSSVCRSNGSMVYTTTWSSGELHGEATHYVSDSRVNRYHFTGGRVTHVNGQPIQSPLLEKLAGGKVDAETAEEFKETNSPTNVSTGGWPVGRIVTSTDATDWNGRQREPWEAMEVLGNAAIVDTGVGKQWQEPPFFPLGIDAASALVLMARAAGCQCDYRCGCVWVTRDVEEPDWRDPTGVCEIEPPAESRLAAVWRTDCRIDEEFRLRPLVDCLNIIGQLHAVQIDTSQLGSTGQNSNVFPVTANVDYYLQFRHALAKVLLQAQCRCELQGETLIILPPVAK
jgi:hypothetical protein